MHGHAVITDPCLFCGKRRSETHDALCLTRRSHNVIEAGPRGPTNRTARPVSLPSGHAAEGHRGEYWYDTPRGGEDWTPLPEPLSADVENVVGHDTNFTPGRSHSRHSYSSTEAGTNSLPPPPASHFHGAHAAPPEVLYPMDNIITYWGTYTSLAAVQASPFYARIEIPVNPRHFEQWRNDVFALPGRYHVKLPEVLTKAVFTLHAVLPIPARYLMQMSTLQLQYLVECMCDEDYDERRRALRGGDVGDDYVESVERKLTTLVRIEGVCEQRVGEAVEGWSGLEAIQSEVMAFEESWYWDRRAIRNREADVRGGDGRLPPPPPAHARSRIPCGSVSNCPSSVAPFRGPRARPKGRGSLSRSLPKDASDWYDPSCYSTFQAWPPATAIRTTEGCTRLPLNHKPCVPAQKPDSPPCSPASDCSTAEPSGPKSPLSSIQNINISISPWDLRALSRVVRHERLDEAALRAVKRIIGDGSSGIAAPDREDGENARRKTRSSPLSKKGTVMQGTPTQPTVSQVVNEEYVRVLGGR